MRVHAFASVLQGNEENEGDFTTDAGSTEGDVVQPFAGCKHSNVAVDLGAPQEHVNEQRSDRKRHANVTVYLAVSTTKR